MGSELELQKLVIMLKQECPKYVSELRKMNIGRSMDHNEKPIMLWRGVKNPKFKAGELSVLKDVRKDRLPLDMPSNIQKRFDNKFKEKFDIRPRSEGLFSTFDMYEAERYGRPFLVFPVGNYNTIWTKLTNDLWDYINSSWEEMLLSDTADQISLSIEEFVDNDMIDRIVSSYHKDNLSDLTKNVTRYLPQTEVTLICDQYYLISSTNVDHVKLLKALIK